MPCRGHPGPCLFEQAHQAWIAGDFLAFMDLFHDDIVWLVNMDGINAPFASSAVGKEDLRWRLQHMMDVFSIDGFNIETMEHGFDSCRSEVRIHYVHRRTGEPLDVMVRFTGWQKDGLLVRFEERADAAYVAAYTRFVQYLMDTGQGRPS
jgi:ketosteroid isomerase-like protein